MKKSVWLLCLFLSTFSLISCDKLFEPAKEPEKKYLSVTSMTPNDAISYLGDISTSFASSNDYYVVRNCLGYSELYVMSAVVEYNGLNPAYSTYFSNLEKNAQMQFDYTNPAYNASKEYVEFIIYFKPEMKTQGYPSSAVAYELRYLCGDFTNPPATGNYAKKLIISPDMQVDILAETMIVSGEKIHYWGSPAGGQLTVQIAPLLADAVPVPYSNDTYDGSFGNTRKLKVTEYPDVWTQMEALGTLNGIYAAFEEDGNIVETVDPYSTIAGPSFIAEYSNLKTAVENFKNRNILAFDKFGEYSYNYNQNFKYVEFVTLPAAPSFTVLVVRLLDTAKLIAGADLCAVDVVPTFGLLMNNDSVYDYICNGGIKKLNPTDKQDVWNALNDLGTDLKLYAVYDIEGRIYTDTESGTKYYGEYTNLNDAVKNYLSDNLRQDGFPNEMKYIFQSGKYYVEYTVKEDSSWVLDLFSPDYYSAGNLDCGVRNSGTAGTTLSLSSF